MKPVRSLVAVVTITLTASMLVGGRSQAQPQPRASAVPSYPDRLVSPDRQLPSGWRSSRDRAVTTVGDANGLHVLAADASSAYRWRTAATLSEPGVDTDQWIGQACVTGSGRRAVVVYAPRQLTNEAGLQWRGALAAVVNLGTGAVSKLPQRVSLAYFDPGCGVGDNVVISREAGGTERGTDAGPASTRLMSVNASTAKIVRTVTVPGQVTGAVPYQDGFAAVRGASVVSVNGHGGTRVLAKTGGEPFRLAADRAGGLAYQVAAGKQAQLRRFDGRQDTLIATTDLGAVQVRAAGGGVAVVGPRASTLAGGHLPGGWRAVNVTASADISTLGGLSVTTASNRFTPTPALRPPAQDGPLPVNITAVVTATGANTSFTVVPGTPGRNGGAPSPALLPGSPPRTGAKPHAASDPSTQTSDPDRACSVPRNDPQYQTYQPTPAQEEWAVDQAVTGHLTGTRGPNLFGSGLPGYSPQSMFPLPGLHGGGQVPPQIMLGVLSQESAEYQASDHAIDGQMGNFMPSSNWYGDFGDFTYVDFSNSDCGYGAGQITSGMCTTASCPAGDSPYPWNSQVAVAIDYQANIAAGLQILEQKWNQLYDASTKMVVNGGDPQYLENWWLALWAYNAGFHSQGSDSSGMWGVGWVNNPINPNYPPDREMFLSGDYNGDIKVPGHWSYEEKVIGFAAYGLYRYDFVAQQTKTAFTKASWPTSAPNAEPGHGVFCTGDDQCTPANPSTPCSRSDFKCWWHQPVTWTNCSTTCGTGHAAYTAGSSEPSAPVPADYKNRCTTGLPANATIVDDIPNGAALGCPGQNYTSKGSMTWKFGSHTNGSNITTYPSKIDLHQIGAGLGGHFWFTHTRPASDTSRTITGTWHPPSSATGWTRILAHIPNSGAWDPQADYTIKLGDGTTRHRVVNQAWRVNKWIDLGAFKLSAGATVSLSNTTVQGLGDDIAWDAMAFVSASAPSTDYVALGDSYSAGQGIEPYNANSDYDYAGMKNACHRSDQAYSHLVTLPGHSTPIAQEAQNVAGNSTFGFIACSSAVTTSVTAKAVSDPMVNTPWDSIHLEYHEPLQADQGWLDANTSLVTLTEGGDDARFSSVLKACIANIEVIDGCLGDNFKMTATNGEADLEPLKTYELDVITALQKHLNATYSAIVDAAPNAKIIVLGYPRLFPGDTNAQKCVLRQAAGVPIISLPAAVTSWLNARGDQLNAVTANAVHEVATQGHDIHFVDPNAEFEGHQVCAQDSDQWINGVISWSDSGSGATPVGAGTFHPRPAGQQAYARLVDNCLAGSITC